MSKAKKSNGVFTDSNILLWICIISSTIFIGLYAAIDFYLGEDCPVWLGALIFGVNLLFAIIAFAVYRKKRQQEESFKAKTLLMEKAMTGMMRNVDIPCILTLKSGLIAWSSKGAHEMLGIRESLLQKNFNDLCNIKIEDLISALPKREEGSESDEYSDSTSLSTVINGKNYIVSIYRQSLGSNSYYLTTFTDYTDYAQLLKKTQAEAPVVAHVVLDNLNEIAEFVRVSYRAAANEIEEILKKFADDMGGFIKEYNRYKYIMVF